MSNYIIDTSLDNIERISKVDEIVTLPSDLLNPYRLIILSSLSRTEILSFQNLKTLTKINSDGNLASHLRTLEKDGLISVHKTFAGRYPKTFYELTNEGKKRFQELLNILENYVAAGKK